MKKRSAFQRVFNSTKSEILIRKGYVFAFSLLLLACLLTFYMNRRLLHHAKQVEHTQLVIGKLGTMMSSLKDGEGGVRSYLITRDKYFLQPYYGSYEAADSMYKELAVLVADNDVQKERLVPLKKWIEERKQISLFNIAEFEAHGLVVTDSMQRLLPATRAIMNNIRKQVAIMIAEEEKLLVARDKDLKSSITTLSIITIASLVIALLLVVFGFIIYNIRNKALKIAGRELDESQEQLKSRIDELNKANAELIHMRNQEKFAATGRIARTIAHEVRNPLTNINLAADQLRSEVNTDETAYLFDMIGRNSTRINQLITELLSSTKFAELNYERVSVHDILDEAVRDAADRIALTNVEVIKRYSNELCELAVDKARIKLAFLNIIINALEAMESREKGQLIIETKTEGRKCRIIITDNGAGMDSESLSRLFEPYFTTRPKGNGLGLTNTQNIILNHKGEIFVESEKGKGTSFTIVLDSAG